MMRRQGEDWRWHAIGGSTYGRLMGRWSQVGEGGRMEIVTEAGR